MKARLPEAPGGKPGPAARPGRASFSGPSSRTKAGDAAGAGAFVFGTLAASLLAAALLLAPGVAWGCANSGTVSSSQDFSCTNAAYPTSIRRVVDSNASLTIRVPGGTGTGGTATVITGEAHWPGIDIDASDNTQTGNYAIYAGTSGAINIVDDTGSGNESRGIRILQDGSGTATVDVGSQVMIGTSSSRMRQHGIYVRGSGSAGAVTVTNAGMVYATYEGLDVKHDGAGTTTVTHSGTVDSLNHGIWARADGTGPLIVTSSGDVTVTNTGQQGIKMESANNGAMTLTATGGTITTPAQGIYMESRGTGAVTLGGTAAGETQSGPTITSSGSHGIHVHKSGSSATAGNISITTTGGSITAGTGTSHGIHVQDRSGYTGNVTIDNAADVTASGGRGINVDRQGSGSVSVTVAAGTTVTGGTAGVYVAGAATGLQVARKYTSGYAQGESADELVTMAALRNQLVTVSGRVVGGTDAAVRLSGGGGVLVLEGGEVRAGADSGDSGVGILADGSALVYIDGLVRGATGGAAAVHLTGGGSITVGLNGRVEANGADHAIKSDGTNTIMLTLVTAGMYREDAEAAYARVDGSIEDVDSVRFREDENGVPTGYSTSLTVPADGMLDTSGLPLRPCPEGQTRVGGECRPGAGPGTGPGTDPGTGPGTGPGTDPGTGPGTDPGTGPGTDPGTGPGAGPETDTPETDTPGTDTPGTDTDVVDVPHVTMPGAFVLRNDGTFDRQETPNDGISITVPKGVNVTAREGINVNVENARPGLMLARKYTPGYREDDDPDELVAVTHGEGAVPLLNQLVTVAGTVTGGTDAAVHISGGGVLVLEGGEVRAGSSRVGIEADGPALVYIDGLVRGATGGAAAVHLAGGGDVIVGLNGKVEANGATHAIQYPDAGSATNTLTLVTAGDVAIGLNGRVQAAGGAHATQSDGSATNTLTVAADRIITFRQDAKEEYDERIEGSLGGSIKEVRFREYRDGEFTGYSSEPLPVDDNGMLDLDASGLPSRDRSGDDGDNGMTFECKKAWDRRCRLYEALPSMLLAMNALPSYAERTSAARDGNGGWARVEASRGEWQAKTAKTETPAAPLAYDHRRSAVRAGIDFHAGESARVGVSVHALGGKAEMREVGEVELDGMGGGLSATWLVGEFYVDAQAAMTLYDIDIESYTHGKLQKKDVHGAGYGLGVDVGRRMSVGGMMVTPRAGVAWSKVGGRGWSSKVDLDDFLDMEPAGGPRARVSVEEAVSVKGRVGVMVERELVMGAASGRLIASLDVEQEFSEETEVMVGRQMLKTEVRPTAVRLGLGGEFVADEDVMVRATAGYRTSGSGTSGYGGGLELQMRF